MTVLKKLPKEILEAGQLIAQVHFEKSVYHESNCLEVYIFVVFCTSKFHFYYSIRDKANRKLKFQDGRCNEFWTCNTAVTGISNVISHWMFHLRLSSIELRDDTDEGKEFAERFLDECYDIKSAVRIVHERKPPAKKIKSKPPRAILPRSDWMALHYPECNPDARNNLPVSL